MTKKTSKKGRPIKQNRPNWRHQKKIDGTHITYEWVEVK